MRGVRLTLREGGTIDAEAFKALILAAIVLYSLKLKPKAANSNA